MDSHTCTVDYGEGPELGTVVDRVCVGPAHTYLDDAFGHVVVFEVVDDAGAVGAGSVVHRVTNAHPIPHEVLAPVDPVGVGETVTATLVFSDPGTEDMHSAVWDWGDGSSSAAVVVESGGSGTATGTHVYDAPGIYTLAVTLLDDDTGFATTVHEHVLVHNLDSGLVRGSGRLVSPEGALVGDPLLDGRVGFNVVARYRDGGASLHGHVSVRFPAGDLYLRSTDLAWLVAVGDQAKLKGTGTINGVGDVVFVVTATNGGSDGDMLRIEIWESTGDGTAGELIYDNRIDGTTPVVERGNITIRP